MNRIWQIAEQVFVVPDINYTFQFTSVHSEELAREGGEPPVHDQELMLKMWDPTGSKCLTITFDRNGHKVRCELDDGATPPILAPSSSAGEQQAADPQARAEDHSYQDVRPAEEPAPWPVAGIGVVPASTVPGGFLGID